MKGKIYEKEKKPFLQSLEFYQKAMENLISQGATLPKKINFNSPPEMALELLEVYYRFHASILKMELKDEDFPPSLEMLKTISEKVKDIDKIMSPAIVDGPGKNGKYLIFLLEIFLSSKMMRIHTYIRELNHNKMIALILIVLNFRSF